jgi:glycosyltransferase involved in cell wall biosynthesis
MHAKISIILATYNRAWCIERAIDSVLSQDYKEWELVIVNDGSTDNTLDILSKYRDKRFKYVEHSKNKGYEAALNTGVDNSTYPYIVFLDSDDKFKPGTLKQIDSDIYMFDKYKVEIIMYQAEDQNGRVFKGAFKDRDIIKYKDLVEERWIKGEALTVFKKSLFDDFRFPLPSGGVPTIFWSRVLKFRTNILFRQKPLRVYYMDNADRLTGGKQMKKRSGAMIILYKKFLEEFEKDYLKSNPSALSYFYLEKGLFEIIGNKKAEGRTSILKSVRFKSKKALIAIPIFILSFFPTTIFIRIAQYGHRYKAALK